MKIVNTYEDLQYPAIRFIINTRGIQTYKLDTANLYKSVSTTYFKFLITINTFKLINKPNA